jgi:hypothetical protein
MAAKYSRRRARASRRPSPAWSTVPGTDVADGWEHRRWRRKECSMYIGIGAIIAILIIIVLVAWVF